MMNFEHVNPVHIIFGKNQIAKLSELISPSENVLVVYGSGSIKKNGVYEQVMNALKNHNVSEFSGIEPNPLYETCMKAVETVKKENKTFLLAAGGGSVIDATKFIAAAVLYKDGDPWNIPLKKLTVDKALPLGVVLTLPATGTEMNKNAVISRKETRQKCAFYSPAVYPKFSILDPQTAFTLPPRYIINGVIDAYVHVMEQYLTYPVNSKIQDRYAEAIFMTLIEEGPKVLKNTKDYDAWANVMWAATSALNGYIGVGVPQDWCTHMIGHELTAEYGLDHAQTLAIVLLGVMQVQRNKKKEKLLQYGTHVFGIVEGIEEKRIDNAIQRTEEFFRSLGQKTRLSEYDLPENVCEVISQRFGKWNIKCGEHQDIDQEKVKQILALRW